MKQRNVLFITGIWTVDKFKPDMTEKLFQSNQWGKS